MLVTVYVSEHGIFVPKRLDLSGLDIGHVFTIRPGSLYTNFERSSFAWPRLADIKACLDAGMYRMALLGALTVPDICGRIEYPDIDGDLERYAKWFDENIDVYNIGHVGKSGDKFSCFNGYMCYLLRCRVVHGNAQNIEDVPNRDRSWFKTSGYDKVLFRFTRGKQSEFYDIQGSGVDKHVAMFHIGVHHLVMQIISSAESVFEKHAGESVFEEPYSFLDMNF